MSISELLLPNPKIWSKLNIESVNTNSLTSSGLQYPISDGTSDQVISTNGAGVLTFIDRQGGAQGAQGAQGPQGPQGSQGIGPQGAQGVQGAQGSQGAQGAQGIGHQGSQGSQGAQGPQGSQGGQGSQGSQGAQGSGAQGSQGPQGSIGTQGSQGPQGSIGTQGSQGPQGSIGTQGSQGAQGPQGAQGSSGSNIYANAFFSGALVSTYATSWQKISSNRSGSNYNSGMTLTGNGLQVITAGLYSVSAHFTATGNVAATLVQIAVANGPSNTGANVTAGTVKNGNSNALGSPSSVCLGVTALLNCSAGNFIEIYGQSTTGMTINLTEWSISATKVN